MKSYVQALPPSQPPGVCAVAAGGKLYRLNVVRAAFQSFAFEERLKSFKRTLGEHTHESLYHLVLYTGGENVFSERGVRRGSGRGALSLIGPGESHVFTPLEPGSCEYVEAALTFVADGGEFLREPFQMVLDRLAGQEPLGKTPPLELGESDVAFVAGRIEEALDALSQGAPLAELRAAKALLDIFVKIVVLQRAEAREGGGGRRRKGAEELEKAKGEIERRYVERLSLGELAGKAGLSPEHFCRKFKAAYGEAPLAYQRKLRLSAAENLLKSSGLSCKEIAFATGFNDEHLLSRVFKKRKGVQPSRCRG